MNTRDVFLICQSIGSLLMILNLTNYKLLWILPQLNTISVTIFQLFFKVFFSYFCWHNSTNTDADWLVYMSMIFSFKYLDFSKRSKFCEWRLEHSPDCHTFQCRLYVVYSKLEICYNITLDMAPDLPGKTTRYWLVSFHENKFANQTNNNR